MVGKKNPRPKEERDVRRRAREVTIQNLQGVTDAAAQCGPDADPLHVIYYAKRMTELAENVLRNAVLEADATGISWERIGLTLGISKQAAHKRFTVAPRVEAGDVTYLVEMLTGQ